jgi:hypothetical protein
MLWSDPISAFIESQQDLTLSQRVTLYLLVALIIAYSLWCLKIIRVLFLRAI